VNNQQRRKLDRQLLEILRDPEAFSIASKFFKEEQQPQISTEPIARVERLGRVLPFLGLALSLGNWLYVVMNPEPNFIFGSCLLFGTLVFLLLAVWESFEWKTNVKVIAAVCSLIVFVCLDGVWHMQRLTQERRKIQELQQAKLRETYKLLTAQMDYSPQDDPISAVFKYFNGGEEPITVTGMSFISNTLRFGRFDIGGDHFFVNSHSVVVDIGGNGHSEPVISHWFMHKIRLEPTPPFTCADIQIIVTYRLNSLPNVPQQKPFRFITSKKGNNNLRWLAEDVGSTDDFCKDPAFQDL